MKKRKKAKKRVLWAALAALAAAGVLAAAGALLLRGGGDGRWSEDQFAYYYLDPYKPFFVEQEDRRGKVRYVGRRAPELTFQHFYKEKRANGFRVFILGGSVANTYDSGEARPTLRQVLRAVLPGRRVEIINAGLSGFNSPRVDRMHEEVMGYDPDLLIVMTGLNETQPGLPPAWAARLAERLGGRSLPGRAWRRILVRACRTGPMTSRRVLRSRFRRHLLRMVRRSKERGVPTILCTLPLNLRDMPPKPSLPLDMPAFREGWVLMEQRRFQEAARSFERVIASGEGTVMGHFCLARCLDRMGRYEEARLHYRTAHGLSSPVPGLNEEVVRKAAREEGVPLADLENVFALMSPNGLTGRNLIEDSVHWFRYADPMVSVTIARSLPAELQGTRTTLEGLVPIESEVIRRLASAKPSIHEAWSVFRLWMWFPLWSEKPMFSEQVLSLLGTIHEADPELLGKTHAFRGWLKSELSKNIWERDAAEQMDAWWPLLLAHVGEFYRRRGERCIAIQYFKEALRLMPELRRARLQMALAYLQEGDAAKAAEARGPEPLSPEERGVWEGYARAWKSGPHGTAACSLDASGLARKMEQGRRTLRSMGL